MIFSSVGFVCFGVYTFDMQSDWDYIEHVKDIFKQKNENVEFYSIELVASKEIRVSSYCGRAISDAQVISIISGCFTVSF